MKLIRLVLTSLLLIGAVSQVFSGTVSHLCGVTHGEFAEGLELRRQNVQGAWTLGEKKVLYMRVRFAEEINLQPSVEEIEQDMTEANTGFKAMSFNQYSLTWAITPVLDVSQPSDYYEDRRDELLQEAYAAAALHGYNYEEFDLDLVRHSGINGWAGGYGYLGRRGAWIQPGGAYIILHEIGHNLGLNHANFWDTSAASSSPKVSPPFPTGTDEGREGHPFDPDSLLGHETIIGLGESREYGDIMDVMGGGDTPPQFNALFKHDLDWLKTGHALNVNQSGVYRLHAFDAAATEPVNNYLLGIDRLGYVRGDLEKYWIQFKGGPSMFAGVPDGVQIHIRPSQDKGSATLLLDMTPGTPDRQIDATLPIGKTFSDKAAGVHITPLRRNGADEFCEVAIYLGDSPENNAPALELHATSLSVQPNESIELTATATDPDGHELAYFWQVDNGLPSLNTNRLTVSWKTPGDYVVRCEVSDLRGGIAAAHVVLRVGEQKSYRITGKVLDQDGHPVVGARVHNGILFRNPGEGAYVYDLTDSRGEYILANLPPGTYTNGVFLSGYTLQRERIGTIQITDSDVEWDFIVREIPSISVRTSSDLIEEGQEGTHFIFTRTGATNDSLSIGFTLQGTAAGRSDYVDYFLKRVSFPAGSRTITLPFNTFIDQEPEGEETLSLVVRFPTEVTRTVIQDGRETFVTFYYPGWELKPGPGTNFWTQTNPEFISGPAATFTIKDAPGTPQQLLSVRDGGVNPIEDPLVEGEFIISRVGDLTQAVTVSYELSGIATVGVDYQGLPKTLIIPAGESSLRVGIVPIPDSEPEGEESIQFTIRPSDDYEIDESKPTAFLTLRDDSLNKLTLSIETAKAGEVKLILLGQPGRVHVLEESIDLKRWAPFRTNILFNNRLEVLLPKDDTGKFFRAYRRE